MSVIDTLRDLIDHLVSNIATIEETSLKAQRNKGIVQLKDDQRRIELIKSWVSVETEDAIQDFCEAARRALRRSNEK